MKEIDGSRLMKKMFIILLGAISVFGGCSSDVDDKKNLQQPISITQKQLDETENLSGKWFYNEENIQFNIEITNDQIKVKKKKTGIKEEENAYNIYDYKNENGKIKVYGITDKRNFYISEVDVDAIYIGGGLVDTDTESAWQIKLYRQK
ncbi:TPA: hypothetical protein QFL11_002281 [Enterococcus faecium]|nr:hypothetical protein [Enterococcus faecium]EME8186385.1 hypothetical protein [Enterococcus faecium]EME8270293.1 hypothetical protein [Enterococcus faecium]ROX42760.1 hypothetical protein EGW26_13395 [Enterococcus faecium]